MKSLGAGRAFVLLVGILVLSILAGPCPGARASEREAGRIVNLRGAVEVSPPGGGDWIPARVDQPLAERQAIRTGRDGRAWLLLSDETLLQINGGTTFILKAVAPAAPWDLASRILPAAWGALKSLYELAEGEIWLRNRNGKVAVDIDAVTAVVGVRGTELNLRKAPDRAVTLTVLRGAVALSNPQGAVSLGPGERASVRPGGAPVKEVLLRPREAVQWTVFVPPFFDSLELPQEGGAGGELLWRKEDLERRFRSFLELRGGDLAGAKRELALLEKRYPDNSLPPMLLGFVSLLLGEREEALAEARRAVRLSPGSANALFVESLVLQSLFDLEGALAVARKALALDGGNVPLLCHAGRLEFALGKIDEARETAEKARALDPRSSEAANLLGFLLLARNLTSEAEEVFLEAVGLDPSLGEPRMGLGLVRMRQGKVEEALREITAAVLLEPQRSLFLSYWGKMLYQVRRFGPALDILSAAEELDPLDPTPHLYRGLILRDLNRPAEAIRSFQKAVALNDNRAVYRSRFLLDQDLAVKNVNLSLLYEQLGLSAWGTNKALSSVKEDYTNFAGHLFLGGSLTGQGDRTIPGGSELLLARILQPANENTLNQFNEYTSFFERPSLGGAVSGTAGSNDAIGGNAIVYGAVPEASLAYSGAVYYGSTDGWRGTNSERTKSAAMMLKIDGTPRDRYYLSLRYLDQRRGDPYTARYEYDAPSDPLDEDRFRSGRFEGGYTHNFSPGSDFLFFLTRVWDRGPFLSHTEIRDVFEIPGLVYDSFWEGTVSRPYTHFQGEVLHAAGRHQFIAGAALYRGENDSENRITDIYTYEGVILDRETETYDAGTDQNLGTVYLQDIWKIRRDLVLEAALYFDRATDSNAFSGVEWDLEGWSPRLGLIWTPTEADTFRIAAFRYFLPFQSYRIDPMDVAGVPIFRNTLEGSRAEEGDLVWEHEWQSGFFALNGFYLTREYREKDEAGDETTYTGRLKGVSFEVNQLLPGGVAVEGLYRFTDGDDENYDGGDRRDHYARAGARYLHPSGFSLFAAQIFKRQNFKEPGRKNETIWVTDCGIGYELPGKRGLVSLAVGNVFNHRFDWVEDGFVFSGRAPARQIVFTTSFYF